MNFTYFVPDTALQTESRKWEVFRIQIQFWTSYPKPQPWLCHGCRLRTAKFCKSIQYGCSNVQLVDLSLKSARHHSLAQPFDAVHLGFHQTSPVVANPAFPKLCHRCPRLPPCGNGTKATDEPKPKSSGASMKVKRRSAVGQPNQPCYRWK